MKNPICDLHIHAGLKAFAAHGHPEFNQRSIWEKFPERSKELQQLNPALKAAIADVGKASQGHLDGCAQANVRALFLAIYPIEQQMFDMQPQKPFKTLFSLVLKGKQPTYLGSSISGIPPEKIEGILDRMRNGKDVGVDYFQQFLQERAYLLDQTRIPSPTTKQSFKIANNYAAFKQQLSDGKTLSIIQTVEGGHAFGHYLFNSTFKKPFEALTKEEKTTLEQSFHQNILRVKREVDGIAAPFFVTFCHHYNNQLAGHARSFSGKSNLLNGLSWPNLPGMRHLLDQVPNMREGFTPLGRAVIRLMLDRRQGKRMLIDSKHMSIASRQEFYQLIRQMREQDNDSVPIVHSHGAISGLNTLEEASHVTENEQLDKGQFFSRWRINLTNEDIVETFDSDGIIGIVLHEGRMPGQAFAKEAKALKKKIKKAKEASLKTALTQQLKDLYLKLIWSNIFHIIKVIKDQRNENGWKLLGFGSDFDGLINPLDSYAEAATFAQLGPDMISYFNAGKEILWVDHGITKAIPPAELQSLLFGKSIERRMEEVLFENTDHFLSKYFTAAYLTEQG
ncbi:MAG: hypothetical protein R2828_02850 [Saprospiraceae bacterium]